MTALSTNSVLCRATVTLYCLVIPVLYFSPLSYFLGRWNNEDLTYCYLVPPIVLYLIWEQRRPLAALPSAPSWQGLPVVAFGIACYWLGELGGEYTLLFISLWLVLAGLLWLQLGWRKLKIIAFPVLFSLAMVPPPNLIAGNLSFKLKLLSSWLGVELLQLLGMTAYREGNLIDLGFTQLQVVDACSGLRYLIPLLVLGVLIAFHSRLSFRKRLLLVASAIPLSIVTNSLRIASVGLLYPVLGASATEGLFHDVTGWLIFMISLALLLLEFRVLARFSPEKPPRPGDAHDPGQAAASRARSDAAGKAPGKDIPGIAEARFALALLMLGGTIVLSHGVEFRERVPLRRALAEFPLALDQWQGVRVPLEPQVLGALKLSDYLLIDYRNRRGETINFYLAYNDSQRKGEATHSPASCLPGSGWLFKESGEIELPVRQADGSAMRVCRCYLEKSGSRMLTYYWFPQRGRVLTSLFQIKYYNFWDALTRHRTDGALVRVITPMRDLEKPETAEKRLREVVALLVPRLAEFLPD